MIKVKTSKIFTMLLVLLISASWVKAQTQLSIGEWRTHLPQRDAKSITQTESEIVISTARSILFLDKEDLSKRSVDKTDGLSETLISKVVYDRFNSQLIIAYLNSNIDILKDGKILNVPEIKENKIIIGSREITDIYIADAGTCYFSTNFGIVKYNLQDHEFISTTFTDFTINSVVSDAGFVYAATQEGLYRINKDDANIADFSRWKFLSGDVGLPAMYDAKSVSFFNNKVYVNVDDNLYVLNGGVFEFIDIQRPSSNYKIEFLSNDSKEHLIIGLKDDGTGSVSRFITKQGNVLQGGAGCINRVLFAIEDEKGRIWYADDWRQIRYTNNLNEGCNRLEFDSPFSYESRHIEAVNGKVYFGSDGADEIFSVSDNRSGIYILNQDQSWENINPEFNPIFNEKHFLSFITVAPFPKENKVFIGSYGAGIALYNLDTKTVKFYNKYNSSLQATVGDTFTTRIFHIAFDKDQNLWATNYAAPRPISVFTKDSTWHSFAVPSPKELSSFTIDDQNRKWFVINGSNSGVLVMDHGETIEDPTDDRYKILNSSNSEISGSVNCVEVDLEGDVWVGTSEGPIVFECDAYDSDCRGNRRKVLEDSIVAYLLETEDIRAIEVDGANRKWFGTRNGIFVQSPDGETQIFKFDESNSPLLSNTIVDLDFDGTTGIMYISSSQGILSLKTNATSGTNTHVESNVYAYPNPVRPEYVGPIAIKGLARDANIKITDINGKLVYETKANGGLAIWDGNDYNGIRAATGVYLVFSASSTNLDNVDTFVTKILIVK